MSYASVLLERIRAEREAAEGTGGTKKRGRGPRASSTQREAP